MQMISDLTIEEFITAYYECRRTKRYTAAALKFEMKLESNLHQLYNELITNTYYPGRSICFVVKYPKIREVWASNFRDRIVHHVLYNRYSTQFYNSFISSEQKTRRSLVVGMNANHIIPD